MLIRRQAVYSDHGATLEPALKGQRLCLSIDGGYFQIPVQTKFRG